MDELDGTWCPECGPGYPVDEEGCCTVCGATATGPGSRRARVALAAEVRFRGELEVKTADYLSADGLRLVALAQRDNARAELGLARGLLQESLGHFQTVIYVRSDWQDAVKDLARRVRELLSEVTPASPGGRE